MRRGLAFSPGHRNRIHNKFIALLLQIASLSSAPAASVHSIFSVAAIILRVG